MMFVTPQSTSMNCPSPLQFGRSLGLQPTFLQSPQFYDSSLIQLQTQAQMVQQNMQIQQLQAQMQNQSNILSSLQLNQSQLNTTQF